MAHFRESNLRLPLILGDKTVHQITADICRPIEGKANKWWWMAFIVAAAALTWWVITVGYTVGTGLGVWGENKTVSWAWDITNFVWWVGIGHAGTLISAILFAVPSKVEIVHQPFRGSDDHLCCYLRCIIYRFTHGSSVGNVLSDSSCKPIRIIVGEFQFTAGVGRVCNLNIFHRITCILVHGIDS